jgi:hypothetical protein
MSIIVLSRGYKTEIAGHDRLAFIPYKDNFSSMKVPWGCPVDLDIQVQEIRPDVHSTAAR